VAAARGTARLAIPPRRPRNSRRKYLDVDAWKKAGVATSNILTHRLELRFTPAGNWKRR